MTTVTWKPWNQAEHVAVINWRFSGRFNFTNPIQSDYKHQRSSYFPGEVKFSEERGRRMQSPHHREASINLTHPPHSMKKSVMEQNTQEDPAANLEYKGNQPLPISSRPSKTPLGPCLTRDPRSTPVQRRFICSELCEWKRQRIGPSCQREAAQSSASSSSLKALRLNPGATEHLDNLSFTYQTTKRKTFSPPARKPSETTFPRKTNYSLLHRQLGSSSSFGSLGTQALTTSQTAPSKKSDFAEAETLAPADKCVPNDSTCTPDQALPTHHRENSTISSASEVPKHPKSGNQVLINRNVSITKDTLKSSSGSLKGEKFTDLSTPGISTIQISDVVSESNCTVSSQPQSNRPSTPYVCKSNKKLARCPRSSAPTKQQLQSENLNGPEKNWEFQTDKSDMMSEISLCASRVARSSDSDSHETKQGFRQISRTASDSPLQKEMRSEASPQVLFKTPTPIRSAKPPACKRTQRTFKCQESSASLDNLRPPTQTPFQKPDTPRPKSCPESLKWKKALEQRFTNRKHGGVGISDDQRWNRSSQLFSLHGHGNKPDSKRGNIDRRESAPSIQSPVDWIRQEKPNISHAHATPDQPSSTSSPELTQAIFSAMSFFMGIPHVESEVSSISIDCYPSPNSDSSPFGLQTSQISRQRANISGYQHYGDVLEPAGAAQESQTQLYFARTS